jgi:hypothetical protein
MIVYNRVGCTDQRRPVRLTRELLPADLLRAAHLDVFWAAKMSRPGNSGGGGGGCPPRAQCVAVRVLAEVGYRAAEVEDIVSARQPGANEADLLKIGATEPIIVLARVSRPAQGRPIEFALNRMVASRTAPLSYRMRG